MKKILFTILTILFFATFSSSLVVHADVYGDLYYNIDSGTITITRCNANVSGNYVIPNEIEGYPVVSIGKSAFTNCIELTSVTIPDSVTSIHDGAFAGCKKIESIRIPESVTYIGQGAFSAYTNRYWAGKVKYIGQNLISAESTLDGVYSIREGTKVIACGAFFCCNVSRVILPDSLMYINDGAFLSCNLDGAIIPNGVIDIGMNAFNGSRVEIVKIPKSVTSIGKDAFGNCKRLKSITVDNENEYYTSLDDNLYDKCKTTLIQYSICKTASSFSVPASITTISSSAFSDCANLKTITLPESITNIDECAFSNCTSLTSMTIPNSVTSVGSNIFNGCSSLKTIYAPISLLGETNLKKGNTANIMYYCTVSYKFDDGTVKTERVFKGDNAVFPTPPSGYDYTYVVDGKKWDGINVESDVEVKVISTPKAITATTYKKLSSTYKFEIKADKELINEPVIVALYDTTGRCIFVKTILFDGDDKGSISTPIFANVDHAIVFVWEGFDHMKPCGGKEIVPID